MSSSQQNALTGGTLGSSGYGFADLYKANVAPTVSRITEKRPTFGMSIGLPSTVPPSFSAAAVI